MGLFTKSVKRSESHVHGFTEAGAGTYTHTPSAVLLSKLARAAGRHRR